MPEEKALMARSEAKSSTIFSTVSIPASGWNTEAREGGDGKLAGSERRWLEREAVGKAGDGGG